MITTICMNPCFDKTATVGRLVAGEVNRMENVRYDLGGKGLNVALVLQRLGIPTTCLGCLGTADEAAFLALLRMEGLPFQYLPLTGKVRANLKVRDMAAGVVTEFNEQGPLMDDEQLARFVSLLQQEAMNSTYTVFSGSAPAGCGDDAYQRCMRALPGQRCVLDASGNALSLCIQEKPFLVKPNISELQDVLGKEFRSLLAIRDAANLLIKDGAQNVIVSMGKEGALFTAGERALYSPALQVKAKSTVGAGDAMLGGILAGLEKGANMRDSFRFGMAAGAASVMTEGTQPLQYDEFERLLPKVMLREV